MVPNISSLSSYILEYQRSCANPAGYWAHVADTFYWRQKYEEVLRWDFEKPDIAWYVNGKLNITENIFERQIYYRRKQVALYWEPNDPGQPTRSLTYQELFEATQQFANVLIAQGVRKGDRVAI